MGTIRAALDQLGFFVVETARYTQFVRQMSPGQVKIDLLAPPLGEFASRVPNDARRVRPRPSVNLHASKLEEALAVDRHALTIPLHGPLSSGAEHSTEVLIPQAFTYLLMKLGAYRDRKDDDDKDYGRHHALDLYRIVGLLTQQEDAHVRQLHAEFADHPTVVKARNVAVSDFISPDGLGRLRIQEHQLYSDTVDLDRFAAELQQLFTVT